MDWHVTRMHMSTHTCHCGTNSRIISVIQRAARET